MNWSGLGWASIQSAVAGGLTLLTTYSQVHNWQDAGIAGGTAALSYLALRLGVNVTGTIRASLSTK